MTHSHYWMDEELFEDKDSVEPEGISLQRITRMAATRRAIANFVNILTGRNDITVRYSSGKDSYTDGETVVIAADDHPEHFDSMVGLALHEGSHVLLSDFSFLQSLARIEDQIRSYEWDVYAGGAIEDIRTRLNDPSASLMRSMVHPVIAGYLPKPSVQSVEMLTAYKSTATQVMGHLKMLMNLMEDRRIDRWVYRTAGGYRPYYEALYERYFFTPEMRKNLRWNPDWRELTIDNYLNRLLMCFHPDADPDALPGLKNLIQRLDLPNIDRIAPDTRDTRWQKSNSYHDMPMIWKEANELYAYILRFVALGQQEQLQRGGQMVPQNVLDLVEDSHSLPNLDPMDRPMVPQAVDDADTTKSGKEKPRTFNGKRGEAQVEKAKDLVNGTMKKKKAKKAEIEQAAALEQAQAQMVQLKGDGIPGGSCMVTRKLTEQVLKQDWFLFGRYNAWASPTLDKVRHAGRRMGQILVHRLQVRNDPVLTKNTRLQHGGLDRRLLAQLGMDITSVFQKSRVDTHKPAMLHLTLDASGSMSGRKWDKVMTIATALAYVGSKMRNVDTVITLRGGNDIPLVCVVFDSRKDQYTSWNKWMPRLSPSGSTPEGLCFKATMELILENSATHDVYFINFSDGEPGFSLDLGTKKGRGRRYYGEGFCQYGGELAERHTRNQIQNIREHGVKVLSYYIDGGYSVPEHDRSWKAFKRMYGQDAQWVNVENATEILRTLNKLLVARV